MFTVVGALVTMGSWTVEAHALSCAMPVSGDLLEAVENGYGSPAMPGMDNRGWAFIRLLRSDGTTVTADVEGTFQAVGDVAQRISFRNVGGAMGTGEQIVTGGRGSLWLVPLVHDGEGFVLTTCALVRPVQPTELSSADPQPVAKKLPPRTGGSDGEVGWLAAGAVTCVVAATLAYTVVRARRRCDPLR